VIRFTFKPDDKDGVDRPERVSVRVCDESGMPQLLDRFREFCLALGYSPTTWDQAIRQAAADVEDGGAP
jgi:hypothetical protein